MWSFITTKWYFVAGELSSVIIFFCNNCVFWAHCNSSSRSALNYILFRLLYPWFGGNRCQTFLNCPEFSQESVYFVQNVLLANDDDWWKKTDGQNLTSFYQFDLFFQNFKNWFMNYLQSVLPHIEKKSLTSRTENKSKYVRFPEHWRFLIDEKYNCLMTYALQMFSFFSNFISFKTFNHLLLN